MDFKNNNFLENNNVYYKLGSNYEFVDKYIFKHSTPSLICFTLVPKNEKNFNDLFNDTFILSKGISEIHIDGNVDYEYKDNTKWRNTTNGAMPIQINKSYVITIYLKATKSLVELEWKGSLIETVALEVKNSNEFFSSSFVTGNTPALNVLENMSFYFEGDTFLNQTPIDENVKQKYIISMTTNNNGSETSTTDSRKNINWGKNIVIYKNIGLKLKINVDGDGAIGRLKYLVIKLDNSKRISEFLNDTIGKLKALNRTLYY